MTDASPASANHELDQRGSPPAQTFSTNQDASAARATTEQILRNAGVQMRSAGEEDKPAMLTFLRKYFFSYEPLNQALMPSGRGSTSDGMEGFATRILADDLSYILETTDGNKEMAAVLLLSLVKREDSPGGNPDDKSPPPPLDPLPPTADPAEFFLRIRAIVQEIDAKGRLFSMYPDIDKILDITIASVDPKYRGRKLAAVVMEQVRNLAEEMGIKLVSATCASHFTALALKKMGYQCVYRLPYNEFLDSAGNPIFTPEPPHTAVTIYTLRLADNQKSV